MSRLYERIKRWGHSKYATALLTFVSFVESSIFPVPPDVMLIPMMIANQKRVWFLAALCSLASILGGILGYCIGFFAFETFGKPLLDILGKADSLVHFQSWYHQYGSLIVFGAGLTPFPYKVITIASGALKLNFGIFIFASILSRSLRFFLEALFIKLFGARIEPILKKHFAGVSILIFLLILAAFILLKFMSNFSLSSKGISF